MQTLTAASCVTSCTTFDGAEREALATIVGIDYFLRINADALARCIARIVDEKKQSTFSQKMWTPFLGRTLGDIYISRIPLVLVVLCTVRTLHLNRTPADAPYLLCLAAFLMCCVCEIFFFRFCFYFANFNPGWIKTRYRVELPRLSSVCSLLCCRVTACLLRMGGGGGISDI